jgi:hypothetical protein
MEETLQRIEKRLEAIEKHLGILDENLSHHISFIERTYDVLRSPLSYVTQKVNCLLGRRGAQSSLPAISHDN